MGQLVLMLDKVELIGKKLNEIELMNCSNVQVQCKKRHCKSKSCNVIAFEKKVIEKIQMRRIESNRFRMLLVCLCRNQMSEFNELK